ncbi:retroelement polyprotein-like [Gossypium australe]|uniref:Retroelement polyprotein-like n=1 Tax=Gossypium australe TaxID=47621 RepID=A0A5B6WIN6_9ROSI|nr:retroelement polyprotein-like [Gossypium australe]
MRWKNFKHKPIRMASCTKKRLNDGMTTKFCHDILPLDNRLKLFLGKLKSRLSGPFMITHVYPYGAVDVKDNKTGFNFKVNGQRLNHYFGAPIICDKSSINFRAHYGPQL